MAETTHPNDTASGSDPLARVLETLRRRGRPVDRATPMAGDVSRRRYVRLTLRGQSAGTSAVLALYPPEMDAACERSLVSGRLLHEAGIRVATVIETACSGSRREGSERDETGWVLLEDLGEETLYDLASQPWEEIEPFFEAAVDLLPRIAALPRQPVEQLNSPLDRALLLRELSLTREAFLEPTGLDLDRHPWSALEHLCEVLGDEPPVPCHRDYGARNLMPLPIALPSGSSASGAVPTVGVLDHQDLRLGPPLYDLASLLNDSLFPPADAEERLLTRAVSSLDLGPGWSAPAARQSYHRAAAQRTLKAVGSYAAFARRGGGRHADLIRPTLERAVEHLRHVPETAAVAPELAARWLSAEPGWTLRSLLD